MTDFYLIVRNPEILSRLPNAGPTSIRLHGYWFKWLWSKLMGADRASWKSLFYSRMRFANAETLLIGPLEVNRPRPWLLGPARALHPEAFDGRHISGKGRAP